MNKTSRTVYNRNVPQQTPTEYCASQAEFFISFHRSPRDVHSCFRVIISRPFSLLYVNYPLRNDDGAASDIIITRRVWLLWIMDIPTITMRTRPLFLSRPKCRTQTRPRVNACKIARMSVARVEYKHVVPRERKGDCTKDGEDSLGGMGPFSSRPSGCTAKNAEFEGVCIYT